MICSFVEEVTSVNYCARYKLFYELYFASPTKQKYLLINIINKY